MNTTVQSQKHGCSWVVEGYFLVVLLRPRTSLKNLGTKGWTEGINLELSLLRRVPVFVPNLTVSC